MGTPLDNPAPEMDNPAPDVTPDPSPDPAVIPDVNPAVVPGWKTGLSSDIMNSPLVQKFEDTPEGINKAFESHANLEKLLGHEKVPIPQGAEDAEGWNRFSKAMGIPDKAEGYGLPNGNIPEAIQDSALSKERFAEVAHAHKLTPSQAKGIWETYNTMQTESYNTFMKGQDEAMTNTINSLRGEWGDTYDTNVELGEMVINKFSDTQEMNDFITASLTKDPKGIKFLAKLGDQFAENKMGEFQMKRFSLGPEHAQDEIDKIMGNEDHAYHSEKATPKEHQAAMDYVNSLYAIINKGKG